MSFLGMKKDGIFVVDVSINGVRKSPPQIMGSWRNTPLKVIKTFFRKFSLKKLWQSKFTALM